MSQHSPLAFSVVAFSQAAYAWKPVGSDKGATTEESGGGDGAGIYATARITYCGSVAANGSKGNVTSSEFSWTPLPCWYAPYLGAKDFKKKKSGGHREPDERPGMGGHAGAALSELKRHYEDEYGWTDTPGNKDYNVDKDGEGMFWAAVENPNEPDLLKRNSCNDLPFWVDNGEAPPPQYEEAVTPEILAALAYQHMQLPDTEVSLAPEQITKMNLSTWAWLDAAVRRRAGDGRQRARLQPAGHDHLGHLLDRHRRCGRRPPGRHLRQRPGRHRPGNPGSQPLTAARSRLRPRAGRSRTDVTGEPQAAVAVTPPTAATPQWPRTAAASDRTCRGPARRTTG
ncbi:hypothetical protein SALBM217S_09826 [Streptomyces griseoloalbus]